MTYAITSDDVRTAAERIAAHVVRTPCVPSESLSRELGCQLWFKAENLQHVGAFKARGATNAVLSLTDEEATRGVVTHSSGNHAAALARAASIRSIAAHIVMPHNSAASKIANVRSYGVEPVFCEPTAEARAAKAAEVEAVTGATMVHPYNDPRVMAGQGTVGLEILDQVNGVDSVLVPVGGGGLLSGVLTAIKSMRPEVTVIACEPGWADDAYRSWKSGQIQSPERYDTIADGLRTPLGTNTFPIIRDLVDDILLVDEAAIAKATRILSERVRLVAEPSGAVTLAGLMSHAERFADRSVVAIVSGGNIDFGACQLGSHPAR